MFFSERSLFVLISVIALLGVINAGYLAWTAAMGGAPVCNFLHGCDVVAASSYSKIFDVPLSTFGVFFYTMVAGFAIWRVFVPAAPALTYIMPLVALGFLLSLYFLYLQAFVIHAYCEYCLFSLFDATVLFVLSLYLWLKERRDDTIDT